MADDPKVVLVDGDDNVRGIADKLDAHLCPGLLHRAISVLIYRIKNEQLELLIAQRSSSKLLWPNFWSNPVCTHPRPDETYLKCSIRRLKEELGIRMNKKMINFLFRFSYEAAYDSKLCEHELDSIFICRRDGRFYPNPKEINALKWWNLDNLRNSMADQPRIYTPWFHTIIYRIELTQYLTKKITDL